MKTKKDFNTMPGGVPVPLLNVQMQGHALRHLSMKASRFLGTLVMAAVIFVAAACGAPIGPSLAMAGAVMDSRTEFCDATALNTGAAGTYLIGNVVDLSVVRDMGNGRPVYFVITVDTAVTSGGAATVQFIFASDAQAAIATDGSATAHYTSAAIPKATLIAGYVAVIVALPLEGVAYEQFLGVLQVTAVAALTAGKVNAYLTLDPPKTKAYPNDPNIV